MNISDLNKILIDYINNNKEKYNIDYKDTIEALKEVLSEIEEDYKKLI